MKNFIVSVCLLAVFMMLAGCARTSQALVQYQENRDRVLLMGCLDKPMVEATLAVVEASISDPAERAKMRSGMVLGEAVSNILCARVLADQSTKVVDGPVQK